MLFVSYNRTPFYFPLNRSRCAIHPFLLGIVLAKAKQRQQLFLNGNDFILIYIYIERERKLFITEKINPSPHNWSHPLIVVGQVSRSFIFISSGQDRSAKSDMTRETDTTNSFINRS